MLDLKAIRENSAEIEAKIKTRDPDFSAEPILKLDSRRRDLLQEVEDLKRQRNEASEQIAQLKRDQKHDEAEVQIKAMKSIADQIKNLDGDLGVVQDELQDILDRLPNIPHETVPVSQVKEESVQIREFGSKTEFDFEPKHHMDIGESLGMLDFARGAQIAGSRYALYKGWGARLEMALIQFFWNFHCVKTGYVPILPPYLGNTESMYTSSQLPKFQDDVYYIEKDELYLNPTSETLICNMHRDEILSVEDLPLRYVGFSACFRREAGAAGEEERGLIRMHQFHKVELFKFATPETSFDELEGIVEDAEAVLKALDLHYRLSLLPTVDMAGQSAKTYDLEIWIPSQQRYYEVSSCSNCTDYQARRGNIRYRPERDAKPEFVHTLNGSGLATSRIMVGILENYQQADGSIVIPEVLREYVGTDIIKAS